MAAGSLREVVVNKLSQIQGLHHVTSLAADARVNNAFFTKTLGLRRVKKTVNFDEPSVYHLYYGDEVGLPGGVITYFVFADIARGRPGVREVGETTFSVPEGALPLWIERLEGAGAEGVKAELLFGEQRLRFAGPDGDSFALVESRTDARTAWTGGGIDASHAIRGFHSVSLRLQDGGATSELLKFMGFEEGDSAPGVRRFVSPNGNGADFVDITTMPNGAPARQGAGSVHHVAFAVSDRAAQLQVRKALADYGCNVTPVIDRDYFWSIYFRTPGGVLFEVATDEPGFASDEDRAHLGEALKLPRQHAHLRKKLEQFLEPIVD
jgi:glyoxalase family protein